MAQDATTPTISVIIPVYNAEKYIAQTIQSALGQTHRPAEILIIDDGSTDRSWEILQSFASEPTVRLLTQPNSGVSCARNHGLAKATGQWIGFLDSDDLLLPSPCHF